VTVSDNGRGIPVDLHPTKKVSGLELAATVLHAGGKFDSDSYKVSSGLHGVGLSVVNALSTWMTIEVRTGGKLWRQEYRTGKPQGPVKVIGDSDGRGTTVNFMPDDTIFKDGIDYSFRALVQRFREMAYLTKGLRFHIADERDIVGARAIDQLVVDFARKQPQRQSDQAGGMRKHPLDRQMRFAGIGGAQHGGDAGAWSPAIGE